MGQKYELIMVRTKHKLTRSSSEELITGGFPFLAKNGVTRTGFALLQKTKEQKDSIDKMYETMFFKTEGFKQWETVVSERCEINPPRLCLTWEDPERRVARKRTTDLQRGPCGFSWVMVNTCFWGNYQSKQRTIWKD